MAFIDTMDYRMFRAVNDLAETAAFFNPLMRFLAEDAKYLFLLGALVYWFTRTKPNRWMISTAVISGCAGLGISGFLGHFFYRDRPFAAHSNVMQLIKHAANASFPSDHAVVVFAVAAAIWLFHKKDGWIWLFLAACIALSRIWTGVHYPMDVMAGALIGVMTSAGIHQLLGRWAPANKGLHWMLDFYEKAEQKVWPNKWKAKPVDTAD